MQKSVQKSVQRPHKKLQFHVSSKSVILCAIVSNEGHGFLRSEMNLCPTTINNPKKSDLCGHCGKHTFTFSVVVDCCEA